MPEEVQIELLDGPREACGVFGAYSPTQHISHLIYFGLFALQHRGQESAGIATSDGETVTVFKDLGLVAQVFDETILAGLDGHVGIGHARYSTTGSNNWANAQPAHRQVGSTSVALGHNGNLTNTAELAVALGVSGATTDSDLMAEGIAQALDDERSDSRGLEVALMEVAPTWKGAFSLVLMDQGRIVGLRDPNGFRPLCLGSMSDGGWVLASETSALDLVGATFVREVAAGEMVVIDANGVKSYHPFEHIQPGLCVFEFVYFARPDSQMYGRSIHAARHEMGRILSEENPVEADVIVPVPESGIPAAQGFAAKSGIPYTDGLVKNRYVGRTFIEPTQMLRDQGIRLKLNPIPENLEGRRVVLVDDSIVRGSTTQKLVNMVPSLASRSKFGVRTAAFGALLWLAIVPLTLYRFTVSKPHELIMQFPMKKVPVLRLDTKSQSSFLAPFKRKSKVLFNGRRRACPQEGVLKDPGNQLRPLIFGPIRDIAVAYGQCASVQWKGPGNGIEQRRLACSV